MRKKKYISPDNLTVTINTNQLFLTGSYHPEITQPTIFYHEEDDTHSQIWSDTNDYNL